MILIMLVIAAVVNLNYTDNSANKINGAIDLDDDDSSINWNRYPTYDITLSESLNIINPGTYHLTGTLQDGFISIDANDGVVRLILDNVSIKNSSGPAIACYSAEDLVIELIGENNLEDGAYYSNDFDEDVAGAIYSKDDLTFQGSGSLNLTANYQDGIVGKDDLKIISGTYNINAADDGIRGKDSVYILGGDFTIVSVADAIKSTNDTENGKGSIFIKGGNFILTTSAKGIKAVNSILIYDGNFNLDTYDDAIHSNNYVGIIDGKIQIKAGDDGIHADRELIIDGGEIIVEKAYEGFEAQVVTINNGNINLTTSDDGINAGGGADSSALNRPGAGTFDADENCVLSINGGKIYLNASGDGVDSNGWLYFNGGEVVVDGPINDGNGALDSGMGIVMNGGKVIAVGSSGMAETLGSSSSVFNLSVYFSSSEPAGTKIEIKNSSGETILSHTSAKTFSHMSVGTEEFEFGSTYTIYINGEKYQDFTITNTTTILGNNYNGQPMAPPNNSRR